MDKEQFLHMAKYYHADVYNLEFPKEFDVRGLKPKDRIAYIEKTVPPEKIMEFFVPGSIGSRKDPGRLYINKNTGQIHLFNDRTETIRENKKGIEQLALNDFHLFPTAGRNE